MPLCTAHHPVYSTHLCELPKFHTGEHTTLYKERGGGYSHRFYWPQAQDDFMNTLADNVAELDQMERDEQKVQDFLNADWEDQMHTQAEIDRASGIDFGSRHDRPQLLHHVRLIDLE